MLNRIACVLVGVATFGLFGCGKDSRPGAENKSGSENVKALPTNNSNTKAEDSNVVLLSLEDFNKQWKANALGMMQKYDDKLVQVTGPIIKFTIEIFETKGIFIIQAGDNFFIRVS